MSIEPPLPLEDYASLAAEMDAGFPQEEALERAKLTDDAWLVAKTYWLKRMGDEAERQRFETTTRYRTFFNAKRAIFLAKWKSRHKKAKPVTPDATPLRHVEELLGMRTVIEPNLSYGLPPPVAIPQAVRVISTPAAPIVGAPIAEPPIVGRSPMPNTPTPPERFVPPPVAAPVSERAPDTAPMPPPTMNHAPPPRVNPPAQVVAPREVSVSNAAPPPLMPTASTLPAPPGPVAPPPMRLDAEAIKQALGSAAVGGRTMSVDIQQLLAAATPFMKKLGEGASGPSTPQPMPPQPVPPRAIASGVSPGASPTSPVPSPTSPVPSPTSPVPSPTSPVSAPVDAKDARPMSLSHRDHPLNRTSTSPTDFAQAVRAATPFKPTPQPTAGAPLPAPPPPPPVVPMTPVPPRPAYPPFGGPAPRPTVAFDDDGGPRTQVVPEGPVDGKNLAPPEPWRAPQKKDNPLAQTMFADFQTSGGTALPFGSEKAEAKPNRSLPAAPPSNTGQPGPPQPHLPHASPPQPSSASPVAKRFTINQFASLTAEIAENPANTAAVRAKYGLSEAQHREESERWTTEFEKNAEIKQRYFGIVHRYREYLRKRPPT